jgi:hypothetical protein
LKVFSGIVPFRSNHIEEKHMNKRLFSVLAVLLIASMVISPVSAGAAVKLSKSVDWTLGSLIASGSVFGLGTTDVTVRLDAVGIPEVSCTNKGGTQAPGQNPVAISASGAEFLVHESYTKNGSSPFVVETEDPSATFTAKQMGCANNTWTAVIEFVYWTHAKLTVLDTASGATLAEQNYDCVTVRVPEDKVTCTAVP